MKDERRGDGGGGCGQSGERTENKEKERWRI